MGVSKLSDVPELCTQANMKKTKNKLQTDFGVSTLLISYSVYEISFGFFFQECACYNLLMERVYKDVNELKAKLVQGIPTIDVRQLATTKSLQRFQVPVAWLHQGWITSCHTLSSWIEGKYHKFANVEGTDQMVSQLMTPTQS